MKSYEDWLTDVWIKIWVDCDYDADEYYTRELFKECEEELKEIYNLYNIDANKAFSQTIEELEYESVSEAAEFIIGYDNYEIDEK